MLGPMDIALAGLLAGAVVLVLRRLVLRGWFAGRIQTKRAALLWSLVLPVAFAASSAVRGQLDPILSVVLIAYGSVQFLAARWILEALGGDRPTST